MPKPKKHPAYLLHRPSGQARVRISGRDHYLGEYGSPESRERYDDLIREWMLNNGQVDRSTLTVDELALKYVAFADGYYRHPDGTPTRAADAIRDALRTLVEMHGRTRIRDFGPLALKAVRETMIQAGLARTNINSRISKIRGCFRWGVENELVPADVLHALQAVVGLKRGRSAARESTPVTPVAEETIQATLAYLSDTIADMVRLQRLTGCRPAEVCMIRPIDVDTSGEVWLYRPESHKTAWRGKERVIAIGPRAQDVLRRYLLRAAEAYCFSPAEAEAKRRADQHEQRQTPLSCGNRPGTNRKSEPRKQPGDRYTTASYRRAITRAVELANRERKDERLELLPNWAPNQLRHSAATEIRSRFGLEAAQVALGHSGAEVTQIYAERDLRLAVEVARQMG